MITFHTEDLLSFFLKSHFLFNAEIKWPPHHFFFFHTAFLVCCLSVLTTYGIHFIANMEPWSIGLLAVLVASFIVTVLLIQRQPQSQQKVAFMVNNFMLLSNERFEWIWTSGSGAEGERDGPFSGILSLLHCHCCRVFGEGKCSRCSQLHHWHVRSSSGLLRTHERVSLPTDWMCDMP